MSDTATPSSSPAGAFLDTLAWRGYVYQHTDADALRAWMTEPNRPAYIGFDATASALHVGSLLQLLLLRKWQQHGGVPVLLIGGGTTRIGDPSGKDKTRTMLSIDQIDDNARALQRLCAQFLSFDDPSITNNAIFVNNADWLPSLNYVDFLRTYGVHFSVNRMLGFESVRTRLDREQHLSFLEFNYMIFQAYDYLELSKRHGVLLQFGGSDQWGNIMNGIDLIRKCTNQVAHCLTTPLLTTASGKKMGKSESGAIWLDASLTPVFDFWQYWRNAEDGDVVRFLKLFTELDPATIEGLEDEIAKALQAGDAAAVLNEAKIRLATAVTRLCHGEEAALNMETYAQQRRVRRDPAITGGSDDGKTLPSTSQAQTASPIDAATMAATPAYDLSLLLRGSSEILMPPGAPSAADTANPDNADPPSRLVERLAQLTVVETMAKAGLCTSKSEGRKLIRQNGVRLGGQVVAQETATLSVADFQRLPTASASASSSHPGWGAILAVGKKRAVLLRFR
ncbi:MAG: tyrosine--tRNA ligase [Alphaproteobacteria bacterium]|nr:tyrosine--tRNA ligase [Alphaproteobacteria bacterium]